MYIVIDVKTGELSPGPARVAAGGADGASAAVAAGLRGAGLRHGRRQAEADPRGGGPLEHAGGAAQGGDTWLKITVIKE